MYPLGDIWWSLETFWILTVWGQECATGISWVGAWRAAEHPANTQERITQPQMSAGPRMGSPGGTPFAPWTAYLQRQSHRKIVTVSKSMICSFLVLLFMFTSPSLVNSRLVPPLGSDHDTLVPSLQVCVDSD